MGFVGGQPAGGHPGVPAPSHHRAGKHGLGRELRLIRHARLSATARISDPRLRRVRLAFDQCAGFLCCITKNHTQLAIHDPSGRARVLPLHSRGLGALLQEPGLSDQNTTGIHQIPYHIRPQSNPHPSASHVAAFSSRCIPSGVGSQRPQPGSNRSCLRAAATDPARRPQPAAPARRRSSPPQLAAAARRRSSPPQLAAAARRRSSPSQLDPMKPARHPDRTSSAANHAARSRRPRDQQFTQQRSPSAAGTLSADDLGWAWDVFRE